MAGTEHMGKSMRTPFVFHHVRPRGRAPHGRAVFFNTRTCSSVYPTVDDTCHFADVRRHRLYISDAALEGTWLMDPDTEPVWSSEQGGLFMQAPGVQLPSEVRYVDP